MKKPSQSALKRAKSTLAGRFLCRLLGDQTGAVLMEYVVLGVLLVAAVVGAVVYFGKGIKNDLHIMTDAPISPSQAQQDRTDAITDNAKNLTTAENHQNAMTGGTGTGSAGAGGK